MSRQDRPRARIANSVDLGHPPVSPFWATEDELPRFRVFFFQRRRDSGATRILIWRLSTMNSDIADFGEFGAPNVCHESTQRRRDPEMRAASTRTLEKGTQMPSPSPDLIPAEPLQSGAMQSERSLTLIEPTERRRVLRRKAGLCWVTFLNEATRSGLLIVAHQWRVF